MRKHLGFREPHPQWPSHLSRASCFPHIGCPGQSRGRPEGAGKESELAWSWGPWLQFRCHCSCSRRHGQTTYPCGGFSFSICYLRGGVDQTVVSIPLLHFFPGKYYMEPQCRKQNCWVEVRIASHSSIHPAFLAQPLPGIPWDPWRNPWVP